MTAMKNNAEFYQMQLRDGAIYLTTFHILAMVTNEIQTMERSCLWTAVACTTLLLYNVKKSSLLNLLFCSTRNCAH